MDKKHFTHTACVSPDYIKSSREPATKLMRMLHSKQYGKDVCIGVGTGGGGGGGGTGGMCPPCFHKLLYKLLTTLLGLDGLFFFFYPIILFL